MLHNVLLPREIYASEEHSMMREMIQEFIHNEILPHTDEWEKNGMVSREIWERAGELGLLCIDMPEQYGGSGLDFSFNALFIEELGRNGVSGPGFSLHPRSRTIASRGLPSFNAVTAFTNTYLYLT